MFRFMKVTIINDISILRWCLFFANKANRANKPCGLRMRTNFFLGISEPSKQKSKQTEQAKKLVRRCSHESRDQNKSQEVL